MNRSRSTTPSEADLVRTSPEATPRIPDHELLRHIGGGSYGEVWLARNALGAYRAVKIVRRANFDHDRPFDREFAGIQKFEPISRQHEGLVDLLQVGRNEAEGYFYYVMELADDANAPVAADVRRLTSPGARVSPPAAASDGRSASGDSQRLLVGDGAAAGDSRAPKSEPPHVGCYEPRTLRSEIQGRTRLPLDECLKVGLALTRALGYLHGQGLVHRDIKPSNIIFVGGVPKLADVGLVARVGEARSYVGTEGFIPPEGPGSPQADLYGLGILLYVMSTGKSHQDFPEPLPDLAAQPDHARWLEFNAVIHKACAADPRARYQSAEEMLAELELLRVGKSVKRTRGHQRLWSRVKKAAVGIVFLAVVVAGVARLARQTPRNEAAEGGPPSTNKMANALCDKALRNLRGDNQRGYPEVYTNLHRAIDLDPRFARPYVGLLELVTRESMPGFTYLPEDNQRTIAQRLMELAPESAAAQCGEATIAFYDWDFPAAERLARRSIQIRPEYEFVHTAYGFMLLKWGRPVEARQQLEIARTLNPSKVQIHRMLAHSYYVERDFPRAIEMYRAAINWQPRDLPSHFYLGCAYRASGEYEKAIDIFEATESLEFGPTPQTAARFNRLRQAFKQNGVRGYWQEEWNQAPTNGFYQRARILAHLADTDGAFKLLNQAYQTHERSGPVADWLTGLVFDEVWDPFRHDPRFKELLDKIGFTKVMPSSRKNQSIR